MTKNLWEDSAAATIPTVNLTGDVEADVAIIGGGIMGTTLALELGKRGIATVLLESEQIASGASSKPGGFVVPHFTFGSPSTIFANLEECQAQWLVSKVGNSASRVFDLIEEHDIDCDARQAGWYQPAHSKAAFAHIKETADEWRNYGFPNEVLSDEETTQRTGVAGYKGSWFSPTGGTIHPLKYTLGLVKRASDMQVAVYQRTPALSVEKVSNKFMVFTPEGRVKADRVVLCTNGLILPGSTNQQRTITNMPVWQCATQPIPSEYREHLFKDGECLSDTRANLFTYRFDNNWRLITGSFEPLGMSAERIGKQMANRLKKLLNLQCDVTVDYLWRGVASVTPSRLPEVHIYNNGLISASACNGRGIAMTTTFGAEIAEAIHGDDFSSLPHQSGDEGLGTLAKLTSRLTRVYPYYAMIKDRLP